MQPWIISQTTSTTLPQNEAGLRSKEDDFFLLAGQAIGVLQRAAPDVLSTSILDLCHAEAMASFALDWPSLDPRALRTALSRKGNPRSEAQSLSREDAVAAVLLQLNNFHGQDLTLETLERWHGMVLNGRLDVQELGRIRTLSDDQSPAPGQALPDLMSAFLDWFNASRTRLPGITRAGLAMLWFETVKPFDVGNSFLGRTVAQIAFKQAIGLSLMPMLAETLSRQTGAYGEAIQATLCGSSPQEWLEWFYSIALDAQRRTIRRIDFIIARNHYYEHQSRLLNNRQNKAMLSILDAGPDGFEGGLSAKIYISITGATVPTTTRDLNDLVDRDILFRTGAKSSARYWLKF